MEFCLAEALRMDDREHLRHCISLVTHIDGRQHRLTACFTGVDGDLNCKRGLLGHVAYVGSELSDKTEAYVHAMDKLLRQYCTFWISCAACTKQAGPKFDKPLYEHIKSIHELFYNVPMCWIDFCTVLGFREL